jgi:type VI secretion system protein ImpF
MATRDTEPPVRASVLDRLIDHDPRNTADPPITRAESVRRLKAALLRDIEWLLNTRRTPETAGDAYPEVQRSLYHYGLPDTTSMSADSPADRQRLLGLVEEVVRIFEPRLMNVRVSPGAAVEGRGRHIRFVIEGVLRLDPEPERIVFDTILEGASGKFLVTGGPDA